MPPNKSLKLVQTISPFEGDPISRRNKKREQARELSSEEVIERNDRLNTELSAMYSYIDPSVDESAIDKVSENPENTGEMVMGNDDLENFQIKIVNEAEVIYHDVLATLKASGMPESEINDSSKANIYKRLLAEVDDVAKSGVDELDTQSAGGNILSNESRNRVIKAVVSEEIMDFYSQSPKEALSSLPADTVKAMYGHLDGGAAEFRTNNDLALLGEQATSYRGGETLESQVENILVEEFKEANENTTPQSHIEETTDNAVDQAREEAFQVFEEIGGDVDQKREELGLGDVQEVVLDSEMLVSDTAAHESQAINQADIKR